MRQKVGRPTIKEVASAAGVSTQTVSRVINERPDVSQGTRKRVQDIINQVGYRPSALARSLISRRSYTLGVVTAGLDYVGPSKTLSGIASAAENAGYSVLLKELSSFDTRDIAPIIQAYVSHHVDGIIWAVPEVGENRKWVNNPLMDIEIPLVYLTMEPQKDLSIVTIDNYLGSRMAVAHLVEQGYRNIGHISGPLDWWEARQRKLGWQDVLAEVGLEAGERHWVKGNWSSESGALGFEKLLEQYPELDSIFVGNDQMALGVIQIAQQKRLRIPEDIALVGFDDIPESAYFCPPLTTIHQDQYSLAKMAVEEIIKTIESIWDESEVEEPANNLTLPPTLVVRQSSRRCEKK